MVGLVRWGQLDLRVSRVSLALKGIPAILARKGFRGSREIQVPQVDKGFRAFKVRRGMLDPKGSKELRATPGTWVLRVTRDPKGPKVFKAKWDRRAFRA